MKRPWRKLIIILLLPKKEVFEKYFSSYESRIDKANIIAFTILMRINNTFSPYNLLFMKTR